MVSKTKASLKDFRTQQLAEHLEDQIETNRSKKSDD